MAFHCYFALHCCYHKCLNFTTFIHHTVTFISLTAEFIGLQERVVLATSSSLEILTELLIVKELKREGLWGVDRDEVLSGPRDDLLWTDHLIWLKLKGSSRLRPK